MVLAQNVGVEGGFRLMRRPDKRRQDSRPDASVADKKPPVGGPPVAERTLQANGPQAVCPKCGAKARLYRTPHGLRCADCVKKMDSAGLGFR